MLKSWNKTRLHTPGPGGSVPQSHFCNVDNIFIQTLESNSMAYINAAHSMKALTGQSASYEHAISTCTAPNQTYWRFEAARYILTSALEHFSLRFSISTSHSIQNLVVHKNVPGCCYACGSKQHSIRHCSATNLRCTNCASDVCPHKFMPCPHCGLTGHYLGQKHRCPFSCPHKDQPDDEINFENLLNAGTIMYLQSIKTYKNVPKPCSESILASCSLIKATRKNLL